MKVKISDLFSGFQDKFFDISVDNLPSRGIIFNDHFIKCNLSVEKNQKGFKMIGKLKAVIESACVRCLVKIPVPLTLPIQIILSNYKEIPPDINDIEIVYFDDNEQYLDLNNLIADLIALEIPINPLCQRNCEGLCSACGINKNKSLCSCRFEKKNTVWNQLKNFKVKKD
tara:strand:+ start:1782 stop:2291 length:510 start_codon:yes stop_codon:yes gene_type:complete